MKFLFSVRRYRSSLLFISLLLGLLSGCSATNDSGTPGDKNIEYGILFSLPDEPISYSEVIQPILDKRCVVCHGCYDAPCQLKMSSISGIERGASKDIVYNGTRIFGEEATRLMFDANNKEEWREKGFYSVLNETDNRTALENLKQSTLYRLLHLKQRYPQARSGLLSDNFQLGLDREQVCPTIGEIDDYTKHKPQWGMPYAMPNLSDKEYNSLVHWIAQGSPDDTVKELSKNSKKQINLWEDFLNQKDNKHQLMSRYIYEHLFHAHIHFKGSSTDEFYQLVRSKTPPGEPISVISTDRPFDDPEVEKIYYRLRLYQASIVAKNHLLYQFSAEKMSRYTELFLTPDYAVEKLPSYDLSIASNPFKTFKDIPSNSRYRFLLDNAHFFIEGFIKGPVCRGQVALNVIEEHFWVLFFNPDSDRATSGSDFLSQYSSNLDLPAESDNTLNIIATWTRYKEKLDVYIKAKQKNFINAAGTGSLDDAMKSIWDGGGVDPNAALTIFRHADSASVNQGLTGGYPETSWIIDYPLLERIHYLLVAGFNVYGNVGHQLNTRLYMDFLRMEGEDNFLAYLPSKERKLIRNGWYQGIREDLDEKLDTNDKWLDKEVVVGYKSDNVQKELYQALETRLKRMAGEPDLINRCNLSDCSQSNNLDDIDKEISIVAGMKGSRLQVFPDLTFLKVIGDEDNLDRAYTIIRNKSYSNISSILDDAETENQDFENDTLTVVKGLHGAYPNFFLEVKEESISDFISVYSNIKTRKEYEEFVYQYGIRRTNSRFWSVADWFQTYYQKQEPLRSGIFDLNRYQNR